MSKQISKTSCPHCSRSLRVEERKIGTTVRCPGCQQQFVVEHVREASATSIDTSESAISIETVQLNADPTITDHVSPATRSPEEPTLRKLGRFELKSLLGADGGGKSHVKKRQVSC